MGFLARFKTDFLQKVVVGGIIDRLDRWLAKLPGNESKTVTGFTVALLAKVVEELPIFGSDYIQPILDNLHELPSEPVVAGGLLWGFVGVFHKGLKWVKARFGPLPEL